MAELNGALAISSRRQLMVKPNQWNVPQNPNGSK
jgi:hypothetical protein